MQAKVTGGLCGRPQEMDTGPALSSAGAVCGGWDPVPETLPGSRRGSGVTRRGHWGPHQERGAGTPTNPFLNSQGKEALKGGTGFFQLPIFSTS